MLLRTYSNDTNSFMRNFFGLFYRASVFVKNYLCNMQNFLQEFLSFITICSKIWISQGS